MPASKYLTKYDRDLSAHAYMEFNVKDISDLAPGDILKPGKIQELSSKVWFQFPPKVTEDGRKGSWQEEEVWGVAPLAIYKASESRAMSLKITYIIDGDWDYEAIKRNIKLIRGYFQRVKDRDAKNEKEADNRNLVVYMKLWAIGGDDPMTFRLKSCDVKYSDTMIGIGDKAFPLRTDITLSLATWTQESNQALSALREKLTPDWY